MDLFAEIFPIFTRPELAAFRLRYHDDEKNGSKGVERPLIRQFKQAYGGLWIIHEGKLVTDADRSAIELSIILDILQQDAPDKFGIVASIERIEDWIIPPNIVAEFVIRTHVLPLDLTLNSALSKFNSVIKTPHANVRVQREFVVRDWAVGDTPALSLSVATRLIYEQSLQAFLETLEDPESAMGSGMRVVQKVTDISGELVKITGTVRERREKMLKKTKSSGLKRLIEGAAGGGLVVKVSNGNRDYELPASILEPVIRPSDYELFKVPRQQAERALRPEPKTRSHYVKVLSDILKEAGIIARAYNSRDFGEHFLKPEFEPYIRFDQKRTRPYNTKSLFDDFSQCGAFHLRELYRHNPIEICVVNATGVKIEDFIEALQRQLTKNFSFTVELLRERRVRVVSLANIESAIKVVEQESPDIILAFLPDEHTQEGDTEYKAYIKSLSLGRGFPTHVIFQSTLDQPESMPEIIMGLLAKTGNTPFALADTLTFADYVVGFDAIHHRKDDAPDELTLVARVYQSNGMFEHFITRTAPVTDEKHVYPLIRDIFPSRIYQSKRIILHCDGALSPDIRQSLMLWGKAIGAGFYPVEIIRRGAPRIYAFEGGRIDVPEAGNAFKLSSHEAFVVLAVDKDQPTPQPIHVVSRNLPIEQALHSIRLWTLLYYGTNLHPQLPVTIYSAGELSYWIKKGGVFPEDEAEVPFWL